MSDLPTDPGLSPAQSPLLSSDEPDSSSQIPSSPPRSPIKTYQQIESEMNELQLKYDRKKKEHEEAYERAVFQKPAFDMGDTYHPQNLLFNEHRRSMLYAYEYGSVPALVEYLYHYAQSKQQPNDTMWQYFIDDDASGDHHLAMILSTIHPMVVRSLICSNLSHRRFNDKIFEGTVLRTTALAPTPGIYMLQLCDQGSDSVSDTQQGSSPAPQGPDHKGKGLSLTGWITLKEKMRLYLQDTTAGNNYSLQVDKKLIPQHDEDVAAANDRYARMFCRNKHQRQVVEEFCDMIENKLEAIAVNTPQHLRDEPADFAISSVGYGGRCSDRVSDHSFNKATSILFGLCNSICKIEWGERYKWEQYQLVYICKEEHRSLAEAACSVLASSYHDELGLNGKRGGIGRELSTDDFAYTDNIKRLFGYGPPSPGGTRRQSTQPMARGVLRSREETDEALKRLRWYHDPNRQSLEAKEKLIAEKEEKCRRMMEEIKDKVAKMNVAKGLTELVKLRDKHPEKFGGPSAGN